MAQENMRQFGKYHLVELRGSGAFSKVWKAYDPQLNRYVAIKFLQTEQHADARAVARFMREAQGGASLRHPNIVQVHELQLSPQNPTDNYMVMDYIEGSTLQEYIKRTSRQGKFPTHGELLRIFTSIAMAVDYAHQHGIIHRDIKPANILLDSHNTTHNTMGEPMLADFGLVKIVSISTGTLQGEILGTPLYMAPEQARGRESNASSDIYSLGVILYEMCTGMPPFHADGPYELLLKQIHDRPPLPRLFNPNISDALQDVIMRCLAKEPLQRYLSAAALVIALARALSLPASLEFVSDISTEEQAKQQPMQQREPMPTQPDVTKPPPVFSREQAGQIPVTPLSTNGSAALVAPALSAPAPVRKVPNPETPVPSVDAMASLFPASQSLLQPNAVIHPPINIPVPPKRPKRRLRGRTGRLLLVLLVLVIISSLVWAILPRFFGGTGATIPATTPVGQVSFFSTKTFYYNTVDKQNEHAINDGLQGTFHLAPPASGDSYYAWLRTSFADSSGMYLTFHNANALTTSDGVTILNYVDANHRNLLALIGSDGDEIITIGEQQTTTTPILEAETRPYQAVIPDQPSSSGLGTYMIHIEHLLSRDPDMDKLGLRNGLDFWFLNNVSELETLTEEIQSHTSSNSLSMVQGWIITSLFYLDGKCATDDIAQVNSGLSTTQPPYILHDTQVSLLNCMQTPVGLGYINHMGTHLYNLSQMPGATSAQKQQIAQIFTSLSRVQVWLENIHIDVLKLIQTYMNNLGSPAALQLRYDMANNAELALSGKIDAQTQQLEQGAVLICDSIQHLAGMSVTKI